MRLRWSPAAATDFESIANYLFEESPQFASQVLGRIQLECTRLMGFPHLGRPGHRKDTRELVVDTFVVVYQIRGEFIYLLRIFHGAQDWRR